MKRVADGVAHVTNASEEVSKNVEHIARSAEEGHFSSISGAKMAEELRRLAMELQTEANRFSIS